MTSQLILANGSGVALASDSAASFYKHVYETKEKIVPLSEPHQIAVVGAGLANFYKLPIAVVVRQWDRSLGDERLSSVEEYRDRFMSWLAHSLDELASPEQRERRALEFFSRRYGYLQKLSRRLERMLEQAEAPKGAGDEEPPELIETRVLGLLREINQELMNLPGSHVISAAAESQVISAELVEGTFKRLWDGVGDDGPVLSSAIEEAFGWLPRSEEIEHEIHTNIKFAIEQHSYFPIDFSRILLSFAGYGSDDLLPEISSVDLAGAFGEHVWFRDVPCRHSRDEEFFCRVHSQAQDDQITQFLTGIGHFGREVVERSRHQVHAEWDKFDYSQRTRERLSHAFDDVIGSLIEEAANFGREVELGKAMMSLANMPLDELANTARSLVDLQKMKKVVTAAVPNVGGQIMVATITLHEGFQWVTPNEPAT